MSLAKARESGASDAGPSPATIVAHRWEGDDVLFRLLRNDPPKERDFVSTVVKGLPAFRSQSSSFLIYTGISLFDSPEGASARAKGRSYLGEVRLKEGLGFYVAKTMSDGHFTVWGDSSALLSVTQVVGLVSRER
jgi:hypothetical protein